MQMLEEVLTAYHEAAHAVAMLHYGLTFSDVTVEPSKTHIAAVRGAPTHDVQCDIIIVIALAGEVAEAYALSQSDDRWDRDHVLKDRFPWLERWALQEPEPSEEAEYWETLSDEPPEGLEAELAEDALVYTEPDFQMAWRLLAELDLTDLEREEVGKELFDTTLEVVKTYWETITAVTTLLAQQMTLEYGDILAVFRGHNPEQVQATLTPT